MTAILGVNAFHGDSAAAIVVDGRLIAAAEEERFKRVKHWAGFPSQAIRYCLCAAGVSLDQVHTVALNQNPRANLLRRLAYPLFGHATVSAIAGRIAARSRRRTIASLLEQEFGARFSGQVRREEHHLCHLASAYFGSRFPEAVAVSVDGFGDFASAAWGIGRGSGLAVARRVHFPHSLGILYQAITQYLGFPSYGDEYKVMGLASYGLPRHMREIQRLVEINPDGTFRLDLRYFLHTSTRMDFSWPEGAPTFAPLFSRELVELLGPPRRPSSEITSRHRDIASSLQAVYEGALFNMLAAAHRQYDVDCLALSGGCAMNSVANGKIYGRTPFRKLYVQAAAGDAGGAVGAAMLAWSRHASAAGDGDPRPLPMDHAYLGPAYSNDYCEALLSTRGVERSPGIRISRMGSAAETCASVARLISEGKVVGWFQGAMEWGPRALGNRSILCDPRRADIRELLNGKIKRRESFRPFAPSVLRESVADWFEVDDDVPFMSQVYPVKPEKRHLIPAVTHVDGTGRLQTVRAQDNPRYHHLIKEFDRLTGIPMLLNTSFNENEPIVCTPDEALDCFLRTDMDVLVMGDIVVLRS